MVNRCFPLNSKIACLIFSIPVYGHARQAKTKRVTRVLNTLTIRHPRCLTSQDLLKIPAAPLSLLNAKRSKQRRERLPSLDISDTHEMPVKQTMLRQDNTLLGLLTNKILPLTAIALTAQTVYKSSLFGLQQ